MSEPGIDKFFAIARERYQILLNRRAGMPREEWTKDPIFQKEYFCNVFRETDKTTEWFRENIREPLRNNPEAVLMAIVAFRWFNRIETWETILQYHGTLEAIFDKWDSNWIKDILTKKGNSPWVTGAYIIKTPDGMNKLEGVLWCVHEFYENMNRNSFKELLDGKLSMKGACQLLQISPYLGNFMSWQICSDARQTCLLESAEDRDTWAQPGPGSNRGVGRVYYNDVNKFRYGNSSDEKEVLELMQDLSNRSKDVRYWPIEWPKLEVIDISHVLCEFDKFCRAEEGGRMKRKYNYNKNNMRENNGSPKGAKSAPSNS